MLDITGCLIRYMEPEVRVMRELERNGRTGETEKR